MGRDGEIQLSVRLPTKFRDECKVYSDGAGQTLAEWIRRAMREKLERDSGTVNNAIIPDEVLRELIREEIQREKEKLIKEHKKKEI